MTSVDLELKKVLLQNGGTISIQDLLDAVERVATLEHVPNAIEGRETQAKRLEAFKNEYVTDPLEVLVGLQGVAEKYANIFDAEIASGKLDKPLTQEQINTLSREFDLFKRMSVLVEALYDARYRGLTNQHLDLVYSDSIVRPPSQVPGKLVPDYPGRRWEFCREGGNRKDPTVEWDKLKELLPPEVWEKAVDRIEHPSTEAWVEEKPNAQKFMDLVLAGEIDLELLGEVLKAGEWTPTKFQPRVIKDG